MRREVASTIAMSVMTHRSPTHRPVTAFLTIAVLYFLGISALAGGYAMATGYTPPRRWLDAIPLVDSWTVPALVLGLGFGAGSLFVAYGVTRRPAWSWTHPLERVTHHHWAWAGTMLLGAGQLVWIGLELVYLPQTSALQAVFGATGLVLLGLPLLPETSRYLARGLETRGSGMDAVGPTG
jgi:hypothetical protein